MRALGSVGAARVLVALVAGAVCGHSLLGVNATLNFVLSSNAIKNLPPPLGGAAGHPGSTASTAPGILYLGGNKYQTVDNYQVRRVWRLWDCCGPAQVPGRKGVNRAQWV